MSELAEPLICLWLSHWLTSPELKGWIVSSWKKSLTLVPEILFVDYLPPPPKVIFLPAPHLNRTMSFLLISRGAWNGSRASFGEVEDCSITQTRCSQGTPCLPFYQTIQERFGLWMKQVRSKLQRQIKGGHNNIILSLGNKRAFTQHDVSKRAFECSE